MQREASLCGLSLAVAAEGEREACAQFAAALEPHQRLAAIDRSNEPRELLQLKLQLRPGVQPSFDRLSVTRSPAGFAVNGDGLSGEIGERSGQLEVFGGSAAVLQTAMRLACALWLASRDGLLLHGASVEVGGRALALLGQSGAGKTTLARRLASAGVRVIADEVAAVRGPSSKMNDHSELGPRLFGHPLPRRLGDGYAPEQGLPLAAIGLLSHAAEGQGPRAVRLGRAQAARAILQRVFLPAADRKIVDGALACAESLSRSVPVFSLELPNDDRATAAALGLFDANAGEVRQ